jgi:phage shock protein C
MFCAHCGHQLAPGSNFCSACGASGVRAASAARNNRIVRPRSPRMIAGVCSGIAIHYGWDINLIRILFAVVTCLTTGAGILFYLAAWLLLPDALYALPPSSRTIPQ